MALRLLGMALMWLGSPATAELQSLFPGPTSAGVADRAPASLFAGSDAGLFRAVVRQPPVQSLPRVGDRVDRLLALIARAEAGPADYDAVQHGARVPPAGLSEGTCDQLYLALRMATLEQHLKKGEPMPFVVDDILIGFDDHRTRVCLEVLAQLSRHIQVLLFTHHRRVLELADTCNDTAKIFRHARPGVG